MPKYDFLLTALVRALENDTFLAEALFFPEFCRYGVNLGRLQESLRANAVQVVESLPALELHRRRSGLLPDTGEISLTVEPPPRSVAWREPVELRFHVARWEQGERERIVYVPALGIEIVGMQAAAGALDGMVESHVRTTLMRMKAAASLKALVWLEREQSLSVTKLSFSAQINTPKQHALRDAEGEERQKSVLAEVGTNLTQTALPEAYEMDEVVARLAEALTGREPQSVLLVGPSGVGKTAAVHELVRRRRKLQLGHTPFWATSGSRLVAGMTGFGMWQERCRQLWREAAKEKAILHLGNLVELMEVGKYVGNAQGVAGFLRPYIARGDLLVVAECAPEQLPVVEREDPHLLDAFLQIRIEEPTPERGREILVRFAREAAKKSGGAEQLGAGGVERVDRLHRRYATYSAYPGRPLRFLKNLLADREPTRELTPREVTHAFSRETGLPLLLLDEAARLDLDATREWFAARVVGQPEAVGLIVDLLATVKAGLTRPRRPIASLLFIGPTGVGKTEMAKSLAEFLFQDRARLTRFDMSEYADPAAVKRLIGGSFTSGGAEGLLTAKVREQPFSVVLFDEFEKAHPSFFDLLLQALGEGRLTDAAGRVADFSNAVVVMTSNLGAGDFMRGVRGFADPASRRDATRHFVTAVRQSLRPEMFNRIDRIMPFAPLGEETVVEIAARELEKLRRRDGLRYRGVTLDAPGDVARALARRGYDARYGARPLKRAVERELLLPLAEKLNRQGGDKPLVVGVRVEDGRLGMSVVEGAQPHGELSATALASDRHAAEITNRAVTLRRKVQRLERCPAMTELGNEIYRLTRLEARLSVAKWKRPEDLEQVARLPRLKRAEQGIGVFARKVYDLEFEALLNVYGKGDAAQHFVGPLVAAESDWRGVLLTLHALRHKEPDRVTLAVFGEGGEWLFALASAYYALAAAEGAKVEVVQFRPQAGAHKRDAAPALERESVKTPEKFLSAPHAGLVGVALAVAAPFARARYEAERGLHVFVRDKKAAKCLVETTEASLGDYKPPAGIARQGAIGAQERRRTFSYDELTVDDAALRRKLHWTGRDLDEVIRRAVEERLQAEAEALIED
jgi:ATP-dependent Clp protease ATP-binding subunit ClpC